MQQTCQASCGVLGAIVASVSAALLDKEYSRNGVQHFFGEHFRIPADRAARKAGGAT